MTKLLNFDFINSSHTLYLHQKLVSMVNEEMAACEPEKVDVVTTPEEQKLLDLIIKIQVIIIDFPLTNVTLICLCSYIYLDMIGIT